MKRSIDRLLLVAALGCATLASAGAAAQAPATAPVPDKKCTAAERKVAKEQLYLKGVEDSIASKQRALQACGTKSLCTKFETNIKAMGRMKVRHEKRIERFSVTRDAACGIKKS